MNRKATFAKRQRETDLKDHARSKEARRVARKDGSRTGKGPEIAWDQAVYPTAPNPDDAPVENGGAQVAANGAPAAAPNGNAPATPATPPAPPNATSHARAHEAAAAAGTKAANSGNPAEKPGTKPNGASASSKLGPRLPSLVPRDDSAG